MTSAKSETPKVAILFGSESDREVMAEAEKVLERFDVSHDARALSAHRTPEAVRAHVRSCEQGGTEVFICAAGMAAHLAGAVAAVTTRPVLGVPLGGGPLNGFDALLSTVQMPAGVPVATLAIGKAGARNAALFAVQILALRDPRLADRLAELKQAMANGERF